MSLKSLAISVTRYLGWLLSFLRKDEAGIYLKISMPKSHIFMGYYDVRLVCDQFIFVHKVSESFTNTLHPSHAEILRYNRLTGEFYKITVSKAVNWQLGSRLNSFKNDLLSFIDIEDSSLITKIIDKDGNILKTYPIPFWCFSSDGRYGFAVDFQRLRTSRPGYGYPGRVPSSLNGSFLIYDLHKEKIEFTIKVQDLPLRLINACDWYFNHVIISPSNKYCLTTVNSEGNERRVIPILIDLQTYSISILENVNFFSHPSFLDDTSILYFNGAGYVRYFFNEKDEQIMAMTKKDGHASITDKGNLITDTYPDRFGKMQLIKIQNNGFYELFSLVNTPKYKGDLRCDLHPRVYDDLIFIDVPTKSCRSIFAVNYH
jgi:hypothetical protein